jgi:dipeptidyl aminopeptidase/acylaminoacyl peptidase
VLTPEIAARAKVSASGLCSLAGRLYWVEGRPELGGAKVVCSWAPGEPASRVVSPEGLSLGSRVHEYGGGECCATWHEGPKLAGVRADDQALVAFAPGSDELEVLVAPEDRVHRGALAARGSTIIFVSEDLAEDQGVARALWHLDLDDGSCRRLHAGRGFYANPVLDEAGERVAFLCWDHPEMPWEAAEVWSASLVAGQLASAEQVGGGSGRPAQSPWFADGALRWLEEREGYARPVEGPAMLGDVVAEHGAPLWSLGEHHLVAAAGEEGARWFATVQVGGVSRLMSVQEGREVDLGIEGTSLTTLAPFEGGCAWLGATPEALGAVGVVGPDGEDRGSLVVAAAPGAEGAPRARSWEVEGPAGTIGALVVVPPGEGPLPGVLLCHGGPTGMARAGYDPLVQLLVAHGLCAVLPNYAGSTGYGAEVRHRLDGAWGVADVADCVQLADALVAEGLLAPGRLAIRGGSAGGFTALLAGTSGRFAAVCSWYGVADLLTLAATTHDFESRYLDRLVGPLPEATQRYVARSPVNRAGEIDAAVLLLQGDDDPVVPPSQAEAMAAALRSAGREVEVVIFPGESHGFRRLDTLQAAYEAELGFYQRHLGDAGR